MYLSRIFLDNSEAKVAQPLGGLGMKGNPAAGNSFAAADLSMIIGEGETDG